MSNWAIILWSLVGSCVMLIVNILVIEHIYGKKEKRWDAFCEEAENTKNELRNLELEFAMHVRNVRTYRKYE